MKNKSISLGRPVDCTVLPDDFLRMLDAISHPIVLKSTGHIYCFANRAACDVFGVP